MRFVLSLFGIRFIDIYFGPPGAEVEFVDDDDDDCGGGQLFATLDNGHYTVLPPIEETWVAPEPVPAEVDGEDWDDEEDWEDDDV